eukprot:6642920-Pyramimonas_sp.AAC.1
MADRFATLALKTQSCKLVPLSEAFSGNPKSRLRGCIWFAAPGWASFEIVESRLYLGVWLGPAVDPERLRRDPITQLRLRARALSVGLAPASMSASSYNSRIVTTLSCIAQFCWHPRDALRLDMGVLAQVFRVALGTFTADAWSHIEE